MKVITGWDFGKALADAGILPANCGDLIIEVPVGGPVIIHSVAFGDDRLLNVIGSSVNRAKIEIRELPEPASLKQLLKKPSERTARRPPLIA